MHIYWDEILGPALALLGPRTIVEIGCAAGQTTRRLVAFCVRSGATLHAIDPAPRFDVEGWGAQAGGRLVFHRARSLDALPGIDGYDAVLVDGDHNWYTVFHELRLIEQQAERAERPFPLVWLHDIGWPYGRRDLYYDPESIPAEYRHPYARAGMRPGSSDLLPQGGFNARLCNATRENTPRNGVLTAVEDFLKQTRLSLRLLLIPGFHGLGVLSPEDLGVTNPPLAGFLQGWDLPAGVKRFVEKVERARVLQSPS